MSDTCCRLGIKQVVRRSLEELHDRGIFEGGRVRDVDDDHCAAESLGETVSGHRVDSRATRRGHYIMAVSCEHRDQPGADEPTATNDDDLHTAPQHASGMER